MNLGSYRRSFVHTIPALLQDVKLLSLKTEKREATKEAIRELFPETASQPLLYFSHKKTSEKKESIKVGVVFSGGQAPGGHDVIAGLYDALTEGSDAVFLLGFLEGPSGIITNKTTKLTSDIIAEYKGQGGFDLLGSGRTKIEKKEDLAASFATIKAHALDAVIIIGGDDSNTNAAVLAEYLFQHGSTTSVIGVPKTIDGDLKSLHIETSFGFDTATKTYSEMVGNIARDALSSKKYYHFIKLMGRSASHIALECAERTHPNMAIISEEVLAKKQSLKDLKKSLVELIQARQEMGKNYGVILLPEGLIEFIPEVKVLIDELNKQTDASQLSNKSQSVWKQLPENIQKQLLADRDPHGNVHVSGIDTEELLMALVQEDVKINAVQHFLGYEGRSAMPSNFDSNYCYALGRTAAVLALKEASGYICGMTGLAGDPREWQPWGVPIVSLLDLETRKGALKPVIKKALVDLKGPVFKRFAAARESWMLTDSYEYPGPIQYFGPEELTESVPLCLQ